MSRKTSAVFHLPRELVRELSADLNPVTDAGFHPLKVDVTVEVSGGLGPSGALIPIKELQTILHGALAAADHLHSNLASIANQLWAHLQAALESRSEGHSPDLRVTSLDLNFENDTRFKITDQTQALVIPYPLRFQHTVEFDLGADGELLQHGHSAEVNVELAADGEDATRLLTHSLTGERIVGAIAAAVNTIGLQQELLKVSLKETEKNGFTASFDKPR